MKNINSNKGITLVSLLCTVIIILILSGTTIYNINVSNKNKKYNNMVADIKLLNDKVLVYYNKYAEIPITNRAINIDENEYYEIDLLKLENLTLNYGHDYGENENLTTYSDVYLVNLDLNIYYLKGTQKSGQVRHEK